MANGIGIWVIDATNPGNVWLGTRYNATTTPNFTWAKYATSKELINGLNQKFDKTGGTIDGNSNVLNLKNTIDNSSVYLSFLRKDGQLRGWVGAGGSGDTISLSNKITGKTLSLTPEGNLVHDGKSVMHVGDRGWGGYGEIVNYTETEMVNHLKSRSSVTSVFRNDYATTSLFTKYAAVALFKASDTYTAISAPYNGDAVSVVGGNGANAFRHIMYSDRNTTTDRNGNLKVPGSSVALSDFPVGSPIPWPQATAPTGFLVCNGQLFNKATYPLLAMAYPSGILPDLRGEFIRGLDSGRNVDSARNVLSAQGDAIRDIEGGFTIDDQIPNTIYPPFGAFKVIPGMVNYDAASDRSSRGLKLEFKASYSGVPTANENRPRNIAFLYIVRAA